MLTKLVIMVTRRLSLPAGKGIAKSENVLIDAGADVNIRTGKVPSVFEKPLGGELRENRRMRSLAWLSKAKMLILSTY